MNQTRTTRGHDKTRRARATTWRAGIVVAAFAVVAASAGTVPASANEPEGGWCSGPRPLCMTVTPSDNLGETNTVQVSGVGFQPGQHVTINQISTKPGASENNVGRFEPNVYKVVAQADADDSGAWGPISVTITRTFVGTHSGTPKDNATLATRTCAPEDDCLLWSASPDYSQRGAFHHLSFTP